jgi:hypothetical protein
VRELLLVVVLGAFAHTSSLTPGAASASRVPSSASASAARSASVKTVGFPPRHDQVEAQRGLAALDRVLGVHVDADRAAVDLADAHAISSSVSIGTPATSRPGSPR